MSFSLQWPQRPEEHLQLNVLSSGNKNTALGNLKNTITDAGSLGKVYVDANLFFIWKS